MPVENILNQFPKVRNAGQSKWRVPCPVHGGKDFNMMISERNDGSVGAHCFVCGANGIQMIEALGLPMKEIFAPDSEYVRPAITRKMREEAEIDRSVLMIAESAEKTGQRLSLEDKRRVRLAKARLEGIEQLKAS